MEQNKKGIIYKQNKIQKYQNTKKTKYNTAKYKRDKKHEGKIQFRQNTNMAKYKVIKYKRNKIQEY